MLITILFSHPLYANEDLMSIGSQELERAFEILSEQDVYWIGMGITDQETITLSASNGSSLDQYQNKNRYADIDLHVGSPELDSTHPLRDAGWYHEETHAFVVLPTENNPQAIQAALWKELDGAYRNGNRRLIKIRSNDIVKVDMEDQSADFSLMTPTTYTGPTSPLSIM